MEDPNTVAKATVQHFKPYLVIIGIIVAAAGPGVFFHGAEFWLVMFAWWVFLVAAGWAALFLYVRFSGKK